MRPTAGNVFVKKADKTKSKFDVVDSTDARWEVTHVANVDVCNPGDLVLVSNYVTYRFKGKDIHVVKESDIVGVEVIK